VLLAVRSTIPSQPLSNGRVGIFAVQVIVVSTVEEAFMLNVVILVVLPVIVPVPFLCSWFDIERIHLGTRRRHGEVVGARCWSVFFL
jgi:hypothetical protein